MVRRLRLNIPIGTISAALVLLSVAALPAFGQQFVATGTYTGNGHSLRSITGVGFRPDLVLVKNSNSEDAYCKTATMAGTGSKSLGQREGIRTDRITSLQPNGFTVADTKEVNESGAVYTWVAMKAGSGLMHLGSYVGNDAAYRFIDGVAFAPEAVLVMTEGRNVVVLRTATMPLGVSLALAGGETFSDRILNTGFGGFSVGSADEVNNEGQTYHFVAWNAADSIVAVGDYTGDGNSGRSISGAGFTPAWVLLASEDEASAVHRPAALGAGDVTQFFNKTANSGGLITSLAADGFIVGGADVANAAGSHFNWLAFHDPISLVELGLTAAATPATAAVGDTVRFTYNLANGSVSDATNVGITTALDAGLGFERHTASAGTYNPVLGVWNLGAVSGGTVESLVLVATIDPGQEGRQLTGTATISAVDQPDPVPANNQATATVTVQVSTPPGIRLQAVGAGHLPATVSAGVRDLTVMNLTLTHAGAADASPVALDSLILALRDAAGQPLDPAAILDRLRVLAGPATLGDLVDPTGPGGRLRLPLGGAVLAPGQSLDLEILADLLPGLTGGSCEFLLAAADIHGHGTTDGTPVVGTEGGGTWPLSSGLASIVAPVGELAVRGEDRMPPLLAPAAAYEVLTLALRNTASPSAGDIALNSLTVSQPAPTAGAVDLGRALDALTVLIDGVVVGTAVGIDPASRSATVEFIEPVPVPAAAAIDLLIAITVRTDAPAGTLTLQIAATGIAAGRPGVPPGGILIVPEPGTVLPLTTSAGNLARADFEASYLNFPNPFAAGREPTTFAFALVEDGRVSLKLYTPHGEAVATVIDAEDRPAGFYQDDTWDGRNGRGEIVRNGVYLAEIAVEFASGTHARFLRKVAVVR